MKLFGTEKQYTSEERELLKREEIERAYVFRDKWNSLCDAARGYFGCGS